MRASRIVALVVLAALAVQGHASALPAAGVLEADTLRASDFPGMEGMSVAQATSDGSDNQLTPCSSSANCSISVTRPRCLTFLDGSSGCFPVLSVGEICNVDRDCEKGLTCAFFDKTKCVADDATGKCCQGPEIKSSTGTSSSKGSPSISGSSSEAASGSTSSKGDDGGSNLGIIIGPAVGGVALIALIAGLIALVITRRKNSTNAGPPPSTPPGPPAPSASLAAQ
jgi:hypothetical protein